MMKFNNAESDADRFAEIYFEEDWRDKAKEAYLIGGELGAELFPECYRSYFLAALEQDTRERLAVITGGVKLFT